ncbi:MAG TPA: hypothetical protein PLA80_13000, partial [Synergistaceae bacterium]|nr:hypothetical protein [Synergistaceae bacterium]
MKEKNVVFPRGLCGFLAVLLLSMVSVLFPQTAQGYTFKPAPEAPEISQNAVDDPYYAELLERFPQHQKTVDALYADYSGWVIELAREYCIAPLLAMEALPEEEYPGLFRDAEIFNDIYESLDPKALSQGERAVLALRLTNVFLLRDPEKEYLEAFWKAQEQDRRAS